MTGVWCLLLALQTFLLGLTIGAGLQLPGWSTGTVLHGLGVLLASAVLAVLLVTPFALAASVGRGYLAGIGVMFATVFVAQIVAVLGYGRYFPWSVPAVFAGAGGSDQPPVGAVGFLLVAVVGATGITATAAWWRAADQTA